MILGDPNITQRSPGYTYPPQKFCVLHSECSITNQMAYEPQRNETTQYKLLDDWLNENTFHCSKQCHNQMCTTFLTAKMWIMMIMMKIMEIKKNNELNENNKLIKYDLTTVDCTYNYTHHGKVSKYVTCTTICVIPISAKSYAFCVTLPIVSQVTSMSAYHLVWYRVCYLPPTRQITNIAHW